jgi:triosephosphate isomerase
VRAPVIVGNWKMHGTLGSARALAAAIRDGCRGLAGVRVAVCPPFTALATVGEVLAGSGVALGAQDMHWEPAGAFTGAVSPVQIADAGGALVLLGHSERRQHFGETDDGVARKVAAALGHGLIPVVCVGETAAERRAGETLSVVGRQLGRALTGRSPAEIGRLWVAYEPVWAIGTGQTATPAQAAEVHAGLRRLVRDRAGAAVADACPILYGGSVRPELTAGLLAEAEIDGALVGGASLEAKDFMGIVGGALDAKGFPGGPAR